MTWVSFQAGTLFACVPTTAPYLHINCHPVQHESAFFPEEQNGRSITLTIHTSRHHVDIYLYSPHTSLWRATQIPIYNWTRCFLVKRSLKFRKSVTRTDEHISTQTLRTGKLGKTVCNCNRQHARQGGHGGLRLYLANSSFIISLFAQILTGP